MKKRLLAFLCVLAILSGMYVMPASAAGIENNTTFKVGYAKRDVNPWVELTIDKDGTKIGIPANQGLDADGKPIPYTDANTNIVMTKIHNPLNHNEIIDQAIVSVPLDGYGNAATRHALYMTDDNGDGVISYGDGLYITCTSVTDSDGTTVLYVTADVGSVPATVVGEIRDAVVEKLGADVIKPDSIMVTANHSHASYSLAKGTAGSAYQAYYNYVIDQVAEAACEAYTTRSQVTAMSRGSIKSSETMKSLGYVNEDGTGVRLNYVRHYYSEGDFFVKKYNTETGKLASSWGKPIVENYPLIRTAHSGDSFFQSASGTNDRFKSYVDDNSYVSIAPVDETLHVLQFTREKGDPVLMINWRAHSTQNAGGGVNKNISGDYANSLRYRLENNKTVFKGNSDYCVAFWQGAGGNVNPGGNGNLWREDNPKDETCQEVKVKWAELGEDADGKATVTVSDDPFYHDYYNSFTKSNGSPNYNNRFYYCAKYGYLLAKIALDCMEKNMVLCETGKILTKQVNVQLDCNQYTYGQYLAAKQWDAAGRPTERQNGIDLFPYWYDADLDEDGIQERYILNSQFHAKSVLKRYSYRDPDLDGKDLLPLEQQSKVSLELNVIKLGSQVAMVTIPGEPFDRYNLNATLDTIADYNQWSELCSDDYGTPFVLGYTNDGTGYLPNSLAYDYLKELRVPLKDKNDTFNKTEYYKNYYNVYDPGSYESNTARMARGSGELVIAKLKTMLDTIEEPLKSARCAACNRVVEWKPVNRDTIADEFEAGQHYYLEENIVSANQDYLKKIGDGTQKGAINVCLDLNGKTWSHNGRIFHVYRYSTLNIMDSGKGGTITAKSGADNYIDGGMMELAGTLNVYGGKLEFVRDEAFLKANGKQHREIKSGGVINAVGYSVINLYDGIIQGGQMGFPYTVKEGKWLAPDALSQGGAIRMVGVSKLNVYGGQILAGEAAKNTTGLQLWYQETDASGNTILEERLASNGVGDCVYVASSAKVNISANAVIDELYCSNYTTSKLTVTGDYTGKTKVQFAPGVTLGTSQDVGNVKDTTSLKPGTLTCVNEGNYRFDISGADLILYQAASAEEDPDVDGAVQVPKWNKNVFTTEFKPAENDGYAYCEACYKQALAAGKSEQEAQEASLKQWEVYDKNALGINSDGAVTSAKSGAHYYLNASLDLTDSRLISLNSANMTICFNLNGCTVTKTGGSANAIMRTHGAGSVLNVMDNSTAGTLIGKAGNTATRGAVIEVRTGTCNIYGGNIRVAAGATPEAITVAATSGNGLNIYGGTFEGGIKVNGSATVTLGGAPVITKIAGYTGLNLAGTGVANIDGLLPEAQIAVEGQQGKVISNVSNNAEAVKNCFAADGGLDVEVGASGALEIIEAKFDPENNNGYAYCEACYKQALAAGKTEQEAWEVSLKQWEVYDKKALGINSDGAVTSAKSGAHYYLNASLDLTDSRLISLNSANMTICFNLNGCTVTKTGGSANAIMRTHGAGSVLNVMDNSTAGTLIGKAGNTATRGAVIEVRTGICNIYGGNIRVAAGATPEAITVAATSGNGLNIYGGTFEGGIKVNGSATVTLGGAPVITKIAGYTGLNLAGTGVANIDGLLPEAQIAVEGQQGKVISNVSANAEAVKNCFTAGEGLKVAVDNGALVIA